MSIELSWFVPFGNCEANLGFGVLDCNCERVFENTLGTREPFGLSAGEIFCNAQILSSIDRAVGKGRTNEHCF